MLLAMTVRIHDACIAFGRAFTRPAEPPRPRLRDLDARTLRDIGVSRPAWPAASSDSDQPFAR